MFGNPFPPVTVARDRLRRRNGAIHQVTESIYTERRLDEMPLLVDALEKTRCTEAAVLEHCRGLGPHVRGCWLLDLLMGKT